MLPGFVVMCGLFSHRFLVSLWLDEKEQVPNRLCAVSGRNTCLLTGAPDGFLRRAKLPAAICNPHPQRRE